MANDSYMNVTLEGLDKSRSTLDRFQWKSIASKWANDIAPKLDSAIRREAPVDTSKLKNSTQVRVQVRGDRVTLQYFAGDVSYVPYVIHGTPPHQIVPKSAKALHWDNVFTKRVFHPGTKPNNYPERAARKMLGEISDAMARAARITK